MRVDGLKQKVVDPLSECPVAQVLLLDDGDHEHGDVRELREAAQVPDELQPVRPWQPVVRDYKIARCVSSSKLPTSDN
jgi:hypothetical protein